MDPARGRLRVRIRVLRNGDLLAGRVALDRDAHCVSPGAEAREAEAARVIRRRGDLAVADQADEGVAERFQIRASERPIRSE